MITNMQNKYVRLVSDLTQKGQLLKEEDINNHINTESEWYTSTYYYNDEHLKQFQKTGSVQGIKDVITKKLWFDFDSKEDPSKAQQDAIEVCNRLLKYKIEEKNIKIYYSGNKGYHIIVDVNKELDPERVASLCINKFGRDLETLDKSIYNASRILRVEGTKNKATGLYKIPLTFKQLKEFKTEDVKKKASSLDNIVEEFDWQPVQVDDEFLKVDVPKREIVKSSYNLNLSEKPSNWKNCKWSINQGNFKSGERHAAMMALAATCRGMGFDKDMAYGLCRVALHKQAKLSGQEVFSKKELYKNVLESVYQDGWEGGQYSCKNPGWLQSYCNTLGEYKCKHEDEHNIVKIDNTFDMFKTYAKNIDNITIKSGIPVLDSKLRMTVGMSVGVVAAPGVGKTSLALQMLNSMSKSNVKCLFFSYDMFHALVFQKLVQKHFKKQPDEIFDLFKSGDKKFENEVLELIKSEYKNVDFCFTQGQTVDDIRRTIKESEQSSGEKVRFVVCDYNELIQTPYSDATASSSFVAQKMRQIAITEECCVLSLFQPNKMSGSPSDELLSYRSAKGSSAIEQSVSVMLGMSRPGFNCHRPEEDVYTTISCLKNRMGNTFHLDLHWNGLEGTVRSLTEEEEYQLQAIRTAKEEEKKKSKAGWMG